ncbi:MAG: DUF5698 domain-containing protein [Candidatus Krumholzibacteriia bacterium]
MLEFLSAHPLTLIPIIFLARVADVSLGTLRTIFVFKGHRLWAAFLGFFEVLIWLQAAGQVIRHLDHWYLTVAYAAGFAMGNVVGSWLEAKLAIGVELVRILGHDPTVGLDRRLRELGYEVASLHGMGSATEPIEILLITERRRKVPALLQTVAKLDPTAACTVNDVKLPGRGQTSRPRRAFPALPDALRVTKRK